MNRSTITALALGLVLLLPTLAFPLGTDHATFLRGGMTIFRGGTLYVDFIDVKPPLVFVIYGLGELFFGHSAIGLRLFDLLWQGLTLYLLIRYVRTISADRWTPIVASAVYAILYVTLQWSQTTQVESLMGIPLLIALLYRQRPTTWTNGLIIGLCFAAMFLLKFTFGIVAVAFSVHALAASARLRDSALLIAQWFIGSILGLVIMLAPFMMQPEFLEGWRQTMDFIKVYSSFPPVNMELVRLGLKAIATFLGDNISIVITAGMIIGSVMSVLRSSTEQQRSSHALLTLIFIGLLFSVAVERRFTPYHFSRLYLIAALLSGPAFAMVMKMRTQWMTFETSTSKLILASTLSMAVVFSPLPRYASVSLMSARSIADPTVYASYMAARTEGTVDLLGYNAVHDWVRSHTTARSHVMMVSVSAAMLTLDIPQQVPSIFADSHIYFAVGAPELWKSKAMEEMQRSSVLIIDTADVHGLVNLHYRTSYESVQHDQRFANIVNTQFTLDTVISTFRIYRHNQRTP